MTGSVLAPVRSTFRLVAVTVVPEAASLVPDEWGEVESIVERALSSRPEAMQRQLVTFLRIIEFLPLLRHGSRFSRLSAGHRTTILTRLQNSSIAKIRRGFWGLRTLIFMGYYVRPEVQAALGYRADPRGWSARRTTGEMRAISASINGEAGSGKGEERNKS